MWFVLLTFSIWHVYLLCLTLCLDTLGMDGWMDGCKVGKVPGSRGLL